MNKKLNSVPSAGTEDDSEQKPKFIPSPPADAKPPVVCSYLSPSTKGKGENKDGQFEITVIEWVDSYGALSGWVNLEDYEPEELVCVSSGIKVYENKKVVALAPNYALSTTYTPRQANGLMVIPKSCIQRITSFSCFEPVSKQKQPRS